MENRITHLSLFAGGLDGWRYGLPLVNTIAAIEKDPEACKSYANNWGEKEIIESPVEAIDYAQYEGIDLITASPPCQPFSVARDINLPQHQSIDTALILCRVLKEARPQNLLIENVPEFRKSYVFQEIVQTALDMGYYVQGKVVNAADYGVPQTRLRFFAVISKKKYIFPLPTHQKQLTLFTKKWISWYDTIEDLIPKFPKSSLAPWQIQRWDRWKTKIQSHALLMEGGGGLPKNKDCPSHTITCSSSRIRLILVSGKDKRTPFRTSDRPSPTILTSHLPKIADIEIERVLKVSPQAIAVIQSFPKTVVLSNPLGLPDATGISRDCRFIGNAVPPKLVNHLFTSFLQNHESKQIGLEKSRIRKSSREVQFKS